MPDNGRNIKARVMHNVINRVAKLCLLIGHGCAQNENNNAWSGAGCSTGDIILIMLGSKQKSMGKLVDFLPHPCCQ